MSAATDTKQERINLRLGHRAKHILERAARFEGKTVSSFILTSALAQAEKTIEAHEVMRLNSQDSEAFFNALDKPVRLNSAHAGQDVRRCITRVFVATTPVDPRVIVGYYTLSTLSIELDQLPDRIARKLPRHPIPAALLGRLAVDQHARGHGVGKMLLANAIQRTLAISDQIAIYAMIVDAIDERAGTSLL